MSGLINVCVYGADDVSRLCSTEKTNELKPDTVVQYEQDARPAVEIVRYIAALDLGIFICLDGSHGNRNVIKFSVHHSRYRTVHIRAGDLIFNTVAVYSENAAGTGNTQHDIPDIFIYEVKDIQRRSTVIIIMFHF